VRHCCYLFNDVGLGHNGVTAVCFNCLRFSLRCIMFNFSRPTTSTCQFRESTTANYLLMFYRQLICSVFVSSCSPCYRLHCQRERCRWCVGLRLSRLATFGYCSSAFFPPSTTAFSAVFVVVTLLLVAAVKKSEKRERGHIQGLPNFLATLII